jgi:dehydrogenase/reductase SDR family protein 12
MRTVDQGADTIIWLAISQDIPSDGNGCFFFDRQIVAEHLTLARTRSTPTDETAFMETLDKLIAPFIRQESS